MLLVSKKAECLQIRKTKQHKKGNRRRPSRHRLIWASGGGPLTGEHLSTGYTTGETQGVVGSGSDLAPPTGWQSPQSGSHPKVAVSLEWQPGVLAPGATVDIIVVLIGLGPFGWVQMVWFKWSGPFGWVHLSGNPHRVPSTRTSLPV